MNDKNEQQKPAADGLESVLELKTVGDFVRWAASRFTEAQLYYGHGTDNALDEAYYLVSRGLHLPHDMPGYMLQSNITKKEKRTLLGLIRQRVEKRIPLPYLFKEAWFAGLPFYVDERVLIPRSPIAELIEARFEPWIAADSVQNILDLCTGSGCIAIACALAFPDSFCVGTDISEAVLRVADINAERHVVQDRVQFIQSDVFDALDLDIRFDIIVSNPPYVDAPDMAALPKEYLHEPRMALAAGEDGLTIVRKILDRAEAFLNPNGILVVEVGNSALALLQQFPELPFTWVDFERGGEGVFVLTREQLIEGKKKSGKE